MSARTVLDCDGCGAEGAERLGPLDLGTGAKVIDLCTGCQDVTGIPKLMALLDEYGVETKARPEPTGTRHSPSYAVYECPICERKPAGRSAAIKHCMNRHGMSEVQASHVMRPAGPTVDCPDCGFLASEGGGLVLHRSAGRCAQLKAAAQA